MGDEKKGFGARWEVSGVLWVVVEGGGGGRGGRVCRVAERRMSKRRGEDGKRVDGKLTKGVTRELAECRAVRVACVYVCVRPPLRSPNGQSVV